MTDDRFFDADHADELERMKNRLRGLEALISSIEFTACGVPEDGIKQLVQDVSDAMTRCADAFDAERHRRLGGARMNTEHRISADSRPAGDSEPRTEEEG